MPVVQRPIADGGDGTVDALTTAGFAALEVSAVGPLGESPTAPVAVRGDTAVVELARVCGLRRLPPGTREPMRSSTFGLGLALLAARGAGFGRVVPWEEAPRLMAASAWRRARRLR